jgi:importin subunit beta-1
MLNILQMVCQGTSARDERIRIASFTCLHEIAANYYAKLPPYMGEVFNISVKAINEDSEEVGLQAVEFWSTLCDIELDLADEDDPAEVRTAGATERGGISRPCQVAQQILRCLHG